jgi:hypothetical protein
MKPSPNFLAFAGRQGLVVQLGNISRKSTLIGPQLAAENLFHPCQVTESDLFCIRASRPIVFALDEYRQRLRCIGTARARAVLSLAGLAGLLVAVPFLLLGCAMVNCYHVTCFHHKWPVRPHYECSVHTTYFMIPTRMTWSFGQTNSLQYQTSPSHMLLVASRSSKT